MVCLQIISKILNTKNYSIIADNNLDDTYFIGYEPEFNFIADHIKEYGYVPDIATFLSKFPEFEVLEVAESDEYLLRTVQEEWLYYKSVPIVQRVAELLKQDANEASEYMIQAVNELKSSTGNKSGVDIIQGASDRLAEYLNKREHKDEWQFTTGFPELDSTIGGIQRNEELIVLFARINQGKSWVLEKICTHIWQLGFNVGYISPEMSPLSIGYRFDTLNKNFSNASLMQGKEDLDEELYTNYVDDILQAKNRFQVATPGDFNKRITVTKLRSWVEKYNLDILAIDGIKYLEDERAHKGDTLSTSLTNISEDLMELSISLGIPVIVVVQANRMGVTDKEVDDTPELEHIKDSDGIGANASKVIALKQTKDGILVMQIKKQRFGPVEGKLNYKWNINTGEFTFIPSYDDARPSQETAQRVQHERRRMQDKGEVF